MSTGPPIHIETISGDDFDLAQLRHNPRFRDRIVELIGQERDRLETCKPEDLPKIQGMIQGFKLLLAEPEAMIKRERERRDREEKNGRRRA
jgi:hypothetical protein